MPKDRNNRRAVARSWVQDVFTMDCRIVFCKCCQRQNHMIHPEATTIYQRNVLTNGPDTFNMELCQAMADASIPWYKLQNPKLKTFLEKYCKRPIPSESEIREDYLNECYENMLNTIRVDVASSHIWIAVNDGTDVKGRYNVNITLGTLSADNTETSRYLLAVQFLDKFDHSTITRFVNDSLDKLWPDGVKYEQVLLLYTNQEEYMVKVATALKNIYPNLIHVTCLAQTLNSVCKLIRAEYNLVNELISNVKKVFIEAPVRILKFRYHFPNLGLPPQALITKWSTWLKAAMYYQKHFEAIKQVVMKFDPETSEIVHTAQKYFNNKEIKNNLIYIGSNFRILSKASKELENPRITLHESIQLVETIKRSLYKAPGRVAHKAFKKFDRQLSNNSGYNALKTVADILSGKNEPELPENITCETAILLKYAPIMCSDVEKDFPNFKAIMSDRRLMPLNLGDLEKITVLYSNSKSETD